MVPEEQYYSLVRRSHPAYFVRRIAGKEIRGRAAKFLSGRMLDIGCGDKSKSLLVGDFVSEYVGLDHEYSPHDISDTDLIGTAYSVPREDSSFDCVLSTAVLEHLEEPVSALREALRVLKPGGTAIYTAPLYWHVHEAPRDFYRYTRHGLEYVFEKAGFEVVEVCALAGFLTTFSAECGYYLQRFRRGILAPLVDVLTWAVNGLCTRLDKGVLRDERFTWLYLVVARKPQQNVN